MDTQDEEFVEKFEAERSNDGYGLVMDKGTAEKQEMAEAFDAPDIGTMMPEEDAEDGGATLEAGSAQEDAEPAAATGVETAPVAPQPAITATELPSFDEPEVKAVAPTAPEKALSFGQAFKAARVAGKKDFQWTNPKTGKTQTFTTQLKSEAKAKAASPAVERAPEPVAEPVAQAAPITPRRESTSGIGPTNVMRPKPGARSIYDSALGGPDPIKTVKDKAARSMNAEVNVEPFLVKGKDGTVRPAESVAELMAARKAAQ